MSQTIFPTTKQETVLPNIHFGERVDIYAQPPEFTEEKLTEQALDVTNLWYQDRTIPNVIEFFKMAELESVIRGSRVFEAISEGEHLLDESDIDITYKGYIIFEEEIAQHKGDRDEIIEMLKQKYNKYGYVRTEEEIHLELAGYFQTRGPTRRRLTSVCEPMTSRIEIEEYDEETERWIKKVELFPAGNTIEQAEQLNESVGESMFIPEPQDGKDVSKALLLLSISLTDLIHIPILNPMIRKLSTSSGGETPLRWMNPYSFINTTNMLLLLQNPTFDLDRYKSGLLLGIKLLGIPARSLKDNIAIGIDYPLETYPDLLNEFTREVTRFLKTAGENELLSLDQQIELGEYWEEKIDYLRIKTLNYLFKSTKKNPGLTMRLCIENPSIFSPFFEEDIYSQIRESTQQLLNTEERLDGNTEINVQVLYDHAEMDNLDMNILLASYLDAIKLDSSLITQVLNNFKPPKSKKLQGCRTTEYNPSVALKIWDQLSPISSV